MRRENLYVLEFKNQEEWKAFVRSGQKPNDVPAAPHKVYKNKGWISWGGYLGTGRYPIKKWFIGRLKKQKDYAQTSGIKTAKAWFVAIRITNFHWDYPQILL